LMCGIAGIVSSIHRDLGPLLKHMLETLHHRGPDGAGYVIGETCQRAQDLESLDFQDRKGNIALGHVRLAITGGGAALQPFQTSDGRLSLTHNGEIYNYQELCRQLNDDNSPSTGSDSEVLLRLVAQEYRGDLAETMQRVLPRLDGVYAIAVTDQHQTIIVRDKIGVRQLYYWSGRNFLAFASEKKPLLALGGKGVEIHRIPPGHLMVINNHCYELYPFWRPEQIRTQTHTSKRETALLAYDQAIKEAVHKRVRNEDHVGVIFSGGVDSVLIAHLVKQLGVPLTCYTAGREDGASDLEWAHWAAERYGFTLQAKVFSTAEIDRIIPEVIRTIEDYSLNQVEVAVPIYASARMAQEAGERVILTGQGADEIFGGYLWYAAIVDREGYGDFVSRSWQDTFLLYKECLEREDKISMAHGMELRVPFLDPDVIRVAFSIAPELKIEPDGDSLGKRIHREYCHSLGVPREIAFRTKEAAQHGANVHDAFEEIAESYGLTPLILERAGYDPERTLTETLGSSSRYGHRYGRQDLWKPLPHVQFYLDSHAAEMGLLTGPPRLHWDQTRRKLAGLDLHPLEGQPE